MTTEVHELPEVGVIVATTISPTSGNSCTSVVICCNFWGAGNDAVKPTQGYIDIAEYPSPLGQFIESVLSRFI